MTDDELRSAIVTDLEANRTTGADRKPLVMSDANLAGRLRVSDLEQFNRVLQALIDDRVVHARPAAKVLASSVQADWDYHRLVEDPLPE